jgi:hypothetical protein
MKNILYFDMYSISTSNQLQQVFHFKTENNQYWMKSKTTMDKKNQPLF